MPEINKHEIRSPELQEVMSEIPGSFLKWGLFLFFGIMLVILGLTWFISSPDIVTAPLTVTTFNPPASLVAVQGGKIGKFFIKNGDRVDENQPVALISNQARWEDIVRLNDFIDVTTDSITWSTAIKEVTLPNDMLLGEMQDQWLRFLSFFSRFREFTSQAYIPAKIELLDMQISRQEEYILEMKNQKLLSEEDLKLTYNSYRRDSNLFNRSSYSISVNEFERSKQELIQKQVAFSSLMSSIKNNESSILKMRETRLDLSVQYEKELNQYYSDLNESMQLLKVSLRQWKEKFLIQSPVKGIITFTSFWSENQNINPGEVIATVIPEDAQSILLKAQIPVSGSGKVHPEQEVNIKLSGYPYMENGILKGKISNVSLVPVKDAYIADIGLTNGMKTNYGVELGFVNGMTGTAEIITENRRLIYRFIRPLNMVNGAGRRAQGRSKRIPNNCTGPELSSQGATDQP